MIFRLDERVIFPDPALAEEDGLLAIEGDLSPERLILAYQNGIFPWYSEGDPILWFAPHQRFVLFPHELRISKSMRQVVRSNKFKVTFNQAFAEVIVACADARREGQDGTWITAEMQQAYINLNKLGIAHSVEVWQDDVLAGGLYGVEVNNIFCGESMFSKISNASKLALITLCQTGNYQMIDCQVYTEHLESMGARMIPRDEYMAMLKS
ncbi:leucyl/phenylalanyl-tRNA--protein transferase [Mucilaginibacter sp. PPCGB 2223]|uniref:leucyl/phenylalanyl-tRNA--protein transferase n=1 Tax=Mucilaginibacter sp. PPCGB 2223 TaxID=1886027 RepID=UPI000825735B|nr:leucyl/phenylalanyl-tRNA--protein transferase [Mucilaginibacter sp. PPCGB 2223]OCX50286.1 leucyl/phenylalanyl-tRNA--protein transferase [Mucilaginibacter sp. PPCGB 2223]